MPWHLLLANLLAHKLRTFLTVASLGLATFLLCLLTSVVVALDAPVQASSTNRLWVQSAVSLFVDLPESYQPKIEGLSGVERTCKFQWFGGIYIDRSNFFAQFGVDADRLLDVFPEIDVVEGKLEDFQARKTACLIGVDLQRRFGWKVGQTVPIIGTIFARNDEKPWEFVVAGVYKSRKTTVDNGTMYFRWDYLDQTIKDGACGGPPSGVGVFVVGLKPGVRLEEVARDIDAEFQAGPQRVQATSEAEFQRQFVSMLGNVTMFLGSIGGGVLFAILLAVLNTMLMAGRERTHDLGILKALGFGDGVAAGLLMCESLLLCAAGGAMGIAGLYAVCAAFLGAVLRKFFPAFDISGQTLLMATLLSLSIGLVAGFVPAWRANVLRPVEALRAEV